MLTEHGNFFTLSWVDDNLASVLTMAGHPHWAVPIHEQAIRRRLNLGDENGLVWSLEALSAAWTAIGETELAGRALGFVAAHRRRLGAVPVPYLTALTTRRSDALVARVGAGRFAELWDEGAALDPGAVWGWFTGPGEARRESAYFVLEDFYTPLETRYTAVAAGDLHSKWTRDEAMCHELAQLQEAFAGEWLFERSDPLAAAGIERYARAALAAGDVNVRFERLDRFSKLQADWTFYSHDFEHGVLKCLSRHWPLDYRVGENRPVAAGL